MKRSLFIVLFLTLFSFIGKGQVYFNKEFTNDSSNSNTAHIVYEYPDTSGYLLIGSFGIPGYKAYLNFTRLDLFGDTIWNKYYRSRSLAQFTNAGNFISFGDTNLVFIGIYSPETSDSMQVNLFRIDTAGNVIWDYIYGDPGKQTPPADIAYTKDGGYIITGYTNGWGAPSVDRTFLLKLDSLGNEEWHKYYFIPGSTSDGGVAVDTTNDNGFIVSGLVYKSSSTNTSDIYVIKVDSAGNQIWVNSYGGPYFDVLRPYLKNIGNNEYILAGGIGVDMGNGENRQYYLAKIGGNSGNVIWADTSGVDQLGYDEQFSSAPVIADNGDIVLAGGFDPGIGITASVVRFTSNGTKLWERTFNKYGGSNQNYLWDIQQTHDKGFIACGHFTNLSAFESPYWAIKLDSLGCDTINCSVGVQETKIQPNEVLIYPNPTNSFINLELTEQPKTETVFRIFDLTGKEAFNQSIHYAITKMDLGSLPKGIYVYRMTGEIEQHAGKLIIQ